MIEERERKRVAKNGVAVYSYKNPALHGFFLSLFVKAGCLYEKPNEAGLTHFLEHTAIRNVEKISGGKLYRDLDRMGLDMNATTYSEMIQFYVAGASEHFAAGAKYLAMLLAPTVLSAEEVNAERKRIKAEIRESDDENSLTTFSSEIVYRGTPLAHSILGSIASVNAQNVKKIEAYRRSVMTAENVFFYATGNFSDRDLDEFVETVGTYELDHAEERNTVAPIPKGFFRRAPEVAVKNADYTVLRFAFDMDMTKISLPESDLLYDVLLTGNSSRFYLEMSEKRGMFYDITGAMERYANIGSFYFTFEVKERDVAESVRLVVSILNDFCKNPVAPEDMMKAGYVDCAEILYDDVREFNFSYAYDNHIAGCSYGAVADRKAAYDAVTPERLREVARIVFRPENLVLTAKSNRKKVSAEALGKITAELEKE